MTREGREQTIMFLHPAEVFGDIAVFTGTTYAPSSRSKTWMCGSFPQKRSSIISRHPDLAMAVIRHLGGRVLHNISLVEDLSLRSVEARLANTLLRNAEVQDGQLIVPRRHWTTFDEMAVSDLSLSMQAGLAPIVFGGSGASLPADFFDFAARALHGFIAPALFLLILLHVGAAFYHQFLLKDKLMARMGYGK